MSGETIVVSSFIVFAIGVTVVAYGTRWVRHRHAKNANVRNGPPRLRPILDIFAARLDREPVDGQAREDLSHSSNEKTP